MSAIPKRDFSILDSVYRYETLTRAQLGELHRDEFEKGDPGGRNLRKRLGVLRGLGLVNQTNMKVVNPAVNGGMCAPVYYPSADGVAFLNQDHETDAFLNVN